MLAMVKDMLKSVYNLNELSLSDMLEVAFEMYPVRIVCADIIAPMMQEIGSMWERGEIMVVMEHFASNVIISKLKALLHKQNTTINAKGPAVIVGCAPEEFHEIGALIVAFFMSLNGWKVIYLGQNIPPSDLMNVVDTMDIHTIALSASSERSLASLKVIGAHISSRATRKTVEFLVGGRLLKMSENMLERIPSATTRSADDLYAYCPPTHPTHQDTMVRGALDCSYSLIRESYRKMRLASQRRKRTQYLLDQITDDSVGAPEPEITGDELTQEFSESLEKIAEFSCAATDDMDCGPQLKHRPEIKEIEESAGPTITPISDSSSNSTATSSSSGSPVITSIDNCSSINSSISSTPSPNPSPSPGSSSAPSPVPTDSSNPSPSALSSASGSPSSTSSPKHPSPASQLPTSPVAIAPPPGSSSPTSEADREEIKERLDKQRKQTQAMKEMLKRYKDGKKAAEDSIARSRAFLNENRMVTAKPKKTQTTPKEEPKPEKVIPPAVMVPLPTNYTVSNRLVTQPKQKPVITTFLHMNDPNAGELFKLGPYKDEPYFPKYMNMPKVGEQRDSSNSSGLSDDDAFLDDGIC